MRIAIIDRKRCRPKKCSLECIDVCPINRSGEKCVFLSGDPEKSTIDEELCIGCGLCIKKCPFKAITVVNTPEKLKEEPIHRFGKNGFTLFRLPFPVQGEVVGLLGPNGVGKTTTLNILSGEMKPNLGKTEETDIKELIRIFRGTELQKHLEQLEKNKIKAVVKPQQIDILSEVNGTAYDTIKKYDEKGITDEIIGKLGLTNCKDRELKQLSGGELQRVAIAITAVRKAGIYYIDEPSSYLDVKQRLQVAKLIRELSKESAVMVVEHDLATLDFLSDRIHVFYGYPGAFGIVSKPYGTRVGINIFLDGFIKEDNVRVRPEPLEFKNIKSAKEGQEEFCLEFTDMVKQFEGFSLEIKKGYVKRGEVLGIFGSNALGKTTFARILAGEIKLDKGEITKKMRISYKPQYISSSFTGTVSELLMSATDKIFTEEYKTEIMRPLGIERLLESQVSNLSGGELQRVAIALCLSKEADLYLLDEPSAYLDVEQRIAVAKTIQRFCEKKECSAMIIDHDLLFLSYLSDRAMLFTGESGKSGSAEQLELQEGFNRFLKEVDITFRKDPQSGRPRANKPGSQKDRDQKEKNRYFYVE